MTLSDHDRAIKHGRCISDKPCKRGHFERYTSTGRCAVCALERAAKWAKDNPERARLNWKTSNSSIAAKERAHLYYEKNKKKFIERVGAWQKNNPDKRYQVQRKWVEKNPHKRAIYNSNRRVRVIQATPEWVNHMEIEAVYIAAQKLTLLTGIRQSVDHIIPLAGINVSGLHVPWNLQVIPYADNCRKGNR